MNRIKGNISPLGAYLLIISLVFSLFILLNDMTYPNPNMPKNYEHRIHRLNLPDSFFELGEYFRYENREYKALLIPPLGGGLRGSTSLIGYWEFDNKVVVDTSHLIHQFVPIPLISADTLALKYAYMHPPTFFRYLEFMNVKYVILNRFLDPSKQEYHLHYRTSVLERNMEQSQRLTKTKDIGDFKIYCLKERPLPLIYASNNIVYSLSESWREFFDLALYLRGYEPYTASYPVFLNRKLPNFEDLRIHRLQSLSKSISLTSINWHETFLPDNTGTIYINENQYGYYLGNISIPVTSLIYLKGNFNDQGDRTWRNIILSGENESLIIQIFLDHKKPSDSALSVQDYYPKDNIRLWNNVSINEVQRNADYRLILLFDGRNLILKLRMGTRVYTNGIVLNGLISNPKLFFMGVNTLWNVNYSVFNSSNLKFPKFKPHNDVFILWRKVSPSKYLVTINASSNGVFIVLNQRYDPKWVLNPLSDKNYEISHYKVNGYANGWHVRSKKQVEGKFEITYAPQRVYSLSLYINVFLAFLAFTMIIFFYVKKLYGER